VRRGHAGTWTRIGVAGRWRPGALTFNRRTARRGGTATARGSVTARRRAARRSDTGPAQRRPAAAGAEGDPRTIGVVRRSAGDRETGDHEADPRHDARTRKRKPKPHDAESPASGPGRLRVLW